MVDAYHLQEGEFARARVLSANVVEPDYINVRFLSYLHEEVRQWGARAMPGTRITRMQAAVKAMDIIPLSFHQPRVGDLVYAASPREPNVWKEATVVELRCHRGWNPEVNARNAAVADVHVAGA